MEKWKSWTESTSNHSLRTDTIILYFSAFSIFLCVPLLLVSVPLQHFLKTIVIFSGIDDDIYKVKIEIQTENKCRDTKGEGEVVG